MASIGHVAIGMAAARLWSGRSGSPSLLVSMLLWSGLSMLPDADVVGFTFGIPYGAPWGHRGATHSFAFSVAVGAAVGLGAACLRTRPQPTASFSRIGLLASLVLASHALLDTLTDGGRGCALFWPVSEARHFAPYRPIPVAPIGLGFLSERGLRVALAELLIFAPVFAYALWPRRAVSAGIARPGGAP
jgi:inner membrane protein